MRKKRHWLPVADMMTGLFLIFLFIALVAIQQKDDFIKEIEGTGELVSPYAELSDEIDRLREEIYRALMREFRRDLRKWNAEIDQETLTFRFFHPRVLFGQGDWDLKPRFQRILSVFFPRYLRVLRPYFEEIKEVKIEGHTSSEWQESTPKQEAYLKNMDLSQKRTQSVLEYLFSLSIYDEGLEQWVRRNITTHGFSSAYLIVDDEGKENKDVSRRVEFRIEIDVRKIIEARKTMEELKRTMEGLGTEKSRM